MSNRLIDLDIQRAARSEAVAFTDDDCLPQRRDRPGRLLAASAAGPTQCGPPEPLPRNEF